MDSIMVGLRNDSTPVWTPAYCFGKRVHQFSASPSGDYLALSFLPPPSKGGYYTDMEGEVGLYHTRGGGLLWTLKADLDGLKATCMENGILLANSMEGTVALAHKDYGKKIWEQKLYPIHIDDSLQMVLGYASPTSTKLKAISLNYGAVAWEQKMKHDYGWNEVKEIPGTSQRLIVADDLHRLDLRTGELKTMKASVAQANAKKLAGDAAIIALLGVTNAIISPGVGYFYMPAYTPRGGYATVPASPIHITGLTSNLMLRDSLLYWADREYLTCMDTALNVRWKVEFPQRQKGSSSLIFQDGDSLFMLNLGYGWKGGRKRKTYGRPFLSCHDMKSGKLNGYHPLSLHREQLQDVLFSKRLYMLQEEAMLHKEYFEPTVRIAPWEKKRRGKLKGFLSRHYFVANKERSMFRPLSEDMDHCLVYTEKDSIYEVDKQLNIKATYTWTDIYKPEFPIGEDYLCVSNHLKEYYFIHHIGMPVFRLKRKFRDAAIVDGILLLLDAEQEDHLIFIDLKKCVE